MLTTAEVCTGDIGCNGGEAACGADASAERLWLDVICRKAPEGGAATVVVVVVVVAAQVISPSIVSNTC